MPTIELTRTRCLETWKLVLKEHKNKNNDSGGSSVVVVAAVMLLHSQCTKQCASTVEMRLLLYGGFTSFYISCQWPRKKKNKTKKTKQKTWALAKSTRLRKKKNALGQKNRNTHTNRQKCIVIFEDFLCCIRNSQTLRPGCRTWRMIWANCPHTSALINASIAWKWPCAGFCCA